MNALLNKSQVKKYSLWVATRAKPFHTFNRVGNDFLERLEAKLRATIWQEIRALPSKGVTIK